MTSGAKKDIRPIGKHFDVQSLAADFESVPALLQDDPVLIRRGAFFDARFQVGIGEIPFDVEIKVGRICSFQRGPFLMRAWQFALRGTLDAWSRYWCPIPEPGWHDLFAMMKRGQMVLEGDLRPAIANLQYLKDLLALPRRLPAR
ncbi:MAG TPA: hypothetical protein VFA65_16325 [Bryobacteraceae bacterium]|nr:hypothetical protein [Bryobacteraceae bacterium]